MLSCNKQKEWKKHVSLLNAIADQYREKNEKDDENDNYDDDDQEGVVLLNDRLLDQGAN